jgi:prepilin-type processing-associated H-X9-DG protein
MESSNMQAGLENAGDPERQRAAKSWKAPRWLFECIVASSVIALLIVFVVPKTYHSGQVPSPRTASCNNLKQIGIAMHDYHHDHKVFPPAAVCNKEGTPLLSWRVLLLPYLEEQSLYSEFKLDEPWDSPNNVALLERMPQVFGFPMREKAKKPYGTHYQVFTGGGAIFQVGPETRPLSLQRIATADGTSKTLLVVEADAPVPWTKPEDLPYSPDQPLPKLGGLFRDGFNVLMADGSVRRFPKDTNEKTIRAAITWNGEEVVNLPD